MRQITPYQVRQIVGLRRLKRRVLPLLRLIPQVHELPAANHHLEVKEGPALLKLFEKLQVGSFDRRQPVMVKDSGRNHFFEEKLTPHTHTKAGGEINIPPCTIKK